MEFKQPYQQPTLNENEQLKGITEIAPRLSGVRAPI